MTTSVYQQIKGKKFIYTFNGNVVRTSSRDFKYACVATNGDRQRVISFGNKKDSTLRSMAEYYSHCTLDVVEIEGR